METDGRPCGGCEDLERLGRRRVLQLLATGAALALAGCSNAVKALGNPTLKGRPAPTHQPGSVTPTARPTPSVTPTTSAVADTPMTTEPPVVVPPPPIPGAHPGAPTVVSAGPPGTQLIALTLDDGYCGDCIARYVDFAHSSGMHITFNPNGVFANLWTPSVVATMQEMINNGQVQIGNHTWDHPNLLRLSDAAVADQITRNENWIQQTFGVTGRPYFRPPFGYYDRRVNAIAGNLGYTRIMMWNGTFGDATLETPQQIMGLAQQWLRPGTIMLGHLNHPPILDLLPQIEAIIAQRNLEPVTLDEMFATSRATGGS